MKSSRFYQTAVQTVGSVGEVVLFLCGFFLGKGRNVLYSSYFSDNKNNT